MAVAFPLTLLVELYLGGSWVDVTGYVLQDATVTIKRGRPDEASKATPSTLSLTLDDRDGRFSPRNPLGPYSGLLGRNTPIRVSAHGVRRFTGEVASWRPEWTLDHRYRVVKVDAAGILRRLGQGQGPARSAARMYYPTAPGVVSYYPLDSGSLTDSLEPVVGSTGAGLTSARAPSAHIGQGKLASWLPNGLALFGADYLIFKIDDMPNFTVANGWVLEFTWYGGRGGNVRVDVETVGQPIPWQVEFQPADENIAITFPNGATAAMTTPGGEFADSLSLYDEGVHVVRLLANWSATFGDLTLYITVDGEANGVAVEAASSYMAKPFVGVIRDLTAHTEPFAIGHVTAMESAGPFDYVGAASLLAVQGYPGESAGRRMERLCAENSITFSSTGDLDATAPMGPQQYVPLLQLLEDCAAADMGTLYEPRDALGLAYRTRANLYNQTAALTLDYSAGQVAPGFVPTEDDQGTRNKVTVKRRDGGEYTAEQTSGPLGTATIGVYDPSATVNVASDAQLSDVAGWLINLGTVDEPRYPGLRVELRALNATLAATVLGVDVDDLIVVNNLTAARIYQPVRVLARGYTETLNTAYLHALTFNSTPAGPYDVAVLDSATRGKLDSLTSTVNTGLVAGATSLSVAIAAGSALWTTSAGQMPIPILVAGEEMSVTAISGASSPQTFTVTRSVNGVVRTTTVPAGTPVRVHPRVAARLAL